MSTSPSFRSGFARSKWESQHPNLWDGLEGLWVPQCGPQGRSLIDFSGNGKLGTFGVSMDPAVDWVPGPKGWALHFNNSSVVCGKVGVFPQFSLAIWLKLTDVVSNKGILGEWNSNLGYMLWLSSGRKAALPINASPHLEGTTTLDIFKWYFIVGTFDGSTARIYVNGLLEGSAAESAPSSAPTSFYIGEYSSGRITGDVDYASVHSRVLSSTEIFDLYRGASPLERKQRRIPVAYDLSASATTVHELEAAVSATPTATGELSVTSTTTTPGQIVAATVLGTSPHDGFVLEIEVAGWGAATGLAVVSGWSSGLDAKINDTDLDTPKGVLTVTSEGYTESGGTFTLGTRQRTLYVGRSMLKAYPDNTVIDTTVDGSNLKIKVSISDYVYADDKNGGAGTSGVDPTLSALAGLFTSDLGSSSAVTDLVVTNSSTKAYPKVKTAFVDPSGNRIQSTYSGRIVCKHPYGQGQPVVGVLFTITDEDSNVVNNAITTPVSEASTEFPTLPRIECYKSTADTTTLTDGKGITVRARAYPFIGDENALFDSNGQTESWRRNRTHRLDRSGTAFRRVYAFVNPASPSGTPACSTTEATARSTPYSSIWAAVIAAKDFINTNYAAANNLDGAEIVLMDNAGADQDFQWGRTSFAASMTAAYAFCVIRSDTSNTGRVRLRTLGTQGNILCSNLWFEGIVIGPSSTAQTNFIIGAGADDRYSFYRCAFESESTSTTATIISSVESADTFECSFLNFSTSTAYGSSGVWMDITGHDYIPFSGNSTCKMGYVLDAGPGGKDFQVSEQNHYSTSAVSTNAFIAFFEDTSLSAPNFNVGYKPTNMYIGHGILRRHSSTVSAQPCISISDIDVEDSFLEHLSIIRDRYNAHNSNPPNKIFDRFINKFIAVWMLASKHDATQFDATLTGGWASHYGVAMEGIYNGSNQFPLNWSGLNSRISSVTLTDFDQVDVDSDATPTAGSEVIGLVGTGRATSKYDLAGNEIPNDGTGSSGALQIAATVIQELDASVTATSTATGSLTVVKAIDASVTSTPTANGTLSVAKQLDASVSSTPTATGSLSVTKSLSANVTATPEVEGTLTVLVGGLSADITATSTASGSLSVSKTLTGIIETAPEADATLTVVKDLTASVTSTPAASASLTVVKALTSTVSSSSEAEGSVTIVKGLSAALVADSEAEGLLSVVKLLTSSVTATATAEAVLTIVGERNYECQLTILKGGTVEGSRFVEVKVIR